MKHHGPDPAVIRLAELLDYLLKTGRQFNAALDPQRGPDVPHLALVGNAEGWEAVNEDGTYDLWFNGDLREADLSLQQCAHRLLDEYEKAKAEVVLARWAKTEGPFTRQQRRKLLAQIRGEIREQGGAGTMPHTPEGAKRAALQIEGMIEGMIEGRLGR